MPKKKIAVLVSGGGSNLQAIIDAVEEGEINGAIDLVIANRSDAYALERARKHKIEAVLLDRRAMGREEYDRQLMGVLCARMPELIILAGYLSILPGELVSRFEGRIINIHPSLIPSFCGKGFYGERVHQAVIEYGVKISGATVHFVDENTDTGPIILQEAVPVLEEDTAQGLAARVLKVEHKLLAKAVRLFCEDKLSVTRRKVTIE